MTPSNNLKGGLRQILNDYAVNESDEWVGKRKDPEIYPAQILNLILDTILASEEMQEFTTKELNGPEVAVSKSFMYGHNQSITQVKAMLEGLKS